MQGPVRRTGRSKLSIRVEEQTAYRKVIGKIIEFAEGILLTKFPDKTRSERIVRAHHYPFWQAAKEIRDLTADEEKQITWELSPAQKLKEAMERLDEENKN